MEINIELFKSRLQLQKYSENSIHSYINCMQQLIPFFKDYKIEMITIELIDNHLNWIIEEKNISKSYQKQIISAIQKYFEWVLNIKIDLSALHPKQLEYLLPNCISKSDIKTMIEKTLNLKHKVIICLLYSCGLRLNELLNLTLKDIDPVKKVIHIIQATDKKERAVMLSPTLLELLHEYYEKYKPKHFIFEGQNGMAYTGKSVQEVVKQAAKRAGIPIPVTPHCLRHSFASHLLENGTDIHFIQELLGHQTVKTTENYINTSDISKTNIHSPLDLL